MADTGPLTAVYDLSRCPASYDFITFAAVARTLAGNRPLRIVFVPGNEGDGFKPGKFKTDEAQFRFQNICVAGAFLFRASPVVCRSRAEAAPYLTGDIYPRGYRVDEPKTGYTHTDIMAAWESTGRMLGPEASKRARAYVSEYVRAFGKPVVSITLRNSRFPVRNSDVAAWMRAAEWLLSVGAQPVFVPDTEDSFSHPWGGGVFPAFMHAAANIDMRMALYESCATNCFTSNGPMILCWYSGAPHLSFNVRAEGYMTAEEWDRLRLPVGTQAPYRREGQKLIWGRDDLGTIKRELSECLTSLGLSSVAV